MYATGNVAPPGKYFIGDPCYAVPANDWEEVLTSTGFLGLYADELDEIRGVYQDKRDCHGVFQLANGYHILASSTAYGDGSYDGSDGFNYGVDAGLLGAVPMEYVLLDNTRPGYYEGLGTIVDFKGSIWIEYDEGKITICSTIPSENISIETSDYPEDDGQPDEAQEWYDFDPDC